MKKDSYIYPAIFKFESDGISIEFPDLPGCLTCAKTDEEAYFMARDALKGHMVVMEEYNDVIPTPSLLKEIKLKENEKAILIQVDMICIRDAVNSKAIKKTLTIPYWLNAIAEREGVNFSFILQNALKEYLKLNK